MKTFLVTGASQGFGLELARQLLAASGEHEVVLPVRTPSKVPDLGPRAKVMTLDLSRLEAVQQFADAWSTPLAGLINNAGVQMVGDITRTPDGYEETVAVNYLAAFVLTRGLQRWVKGGRVMFIGSATHVPKFPANLMGFRGTKFTSLEASARGEAELTARDRYSTSKFLCTVSAPMFAARDAGATYLTLDPGLMAGTGLARGYAPGARWVWRNVLPWLTPLVMPGASTVARSAKTATWLMTADGQKSGGVYEYTRRDAPVHPLVNDATFAAKLFAETSALVQRGPVTRAA